MHMHTMVYMWKEGQLAGVSSLLIQREPCGLDSGHQAWWQTPRVISLFPPSFLRQASVWDLTEKAVLVGQLTPRNPSVFISPVLVLHIHAAIPGFLCRHWEMSYACMTSSRLIYFPLLCTLFLYKWLKHLQILKFKEDGCNLWSPLNTEGWLCSM